MYLVFNLQKLIRRNLVYSLISYSYSKKNKPKWTWWARGVKCLLKIVQLAWQWFPEHTQMQGTNWTLFYFSRQLFSMNKNLFFFQHFFCSTCTTLTAVLLNIVLMKQKNFLDHFWESIYANGIHKYGHSFNEQPLKLITTRIAKARNQIS